MINTAKFALYIIFHPIDGFWELKYHKKKTFAAANFILALLCAANIMAIQFNSFHYGSLLRDENNILINITSLVLPLLAWTVLNWALSTLLDGKATMKQIWVQSVFSLTPMLLSIPILVVFTYVMTFDEMAFFSLIQNAAVLWCAFLFLFGNMTIQDYTFSKTIVMTLFTFAGIAAAIFIGIIFFSTFQQLVSFIST
ncbi:MAG: hypothetical protein LBS21_09670, partial [Clostridiales bacterium]|nr:hypothetical protein [Clostridiales bacterium]